MIILAIDGLDPELVEEYGCENLKQENYGKTDITEFNEPRTIVLWSSFLTGENREEEIPKGKDKLWRYSVKHEETFLDINGMPLVMDVPGYSYNQVMHKKERRLMSAYFRNDCPRDIRDRLETLLYDDVTNKQHRLVEATRNNFYDIIVCYTSLVDILCHIEIGNEEKIKKAYEAVDELAKLSKTTEHRVLVISDHGMKPISEDSMFGDHRQEHGYWSYSKEIELDRPEITDFYDFIVDRLS